jgi:hypothetical protein
MNTRAATLSLLLVSSAAAQTIGFRYERPVVPGSAGPNRLAPDVTLLSGAAPDLSDLRFSRPRVRRSPICSYLQ